MNFFSNATYTLDGYDPFKPSSYPIVVEVLSSGLVKCVETPEDLPQKVEFKVISGDTTYEK